MKLKAILVPVLVAMFIFPAWPQFGSSIDVVLSWTDHIIGPTNGSVLYGPSAADPTTGFEYCTYRVFPGGGGTSQAHLLKQDGYGATRYNYVFNSSGLSFVDRVAVDSSTGTAYMLVNEDIFANMQESYDERLIGVNSLGQQVLNQIIFTNPYGVLGLELYPGSNHDTYVGLSESQAFPGPTAPLPLLHFMHFDSNGNTLFDAEDSTVYPYSATHNPQTGALYVVGGMRTSMGGSFFGKYDPTTGANDFFHENPNTSSTQFGMELVPDASGSFLNGSWVYILVTNQFVVQNNATTPTFSFDVFGANDQHLFGVPSQPGDAFQAGDVNGSADIWGADAQGHQFFESFNKTGTKTRLTSLPTNLNGVTFMPFNIAAVEQSSSSQFQEFIYSQYFTLLASYENSATGSRGIVNPDLQPGLGDTVYVNWSENDTGTTLNGNERKTQIDAPLFVALTGPAGTKCNESFNVTVGSNAPAGANGLKVLLTMHATRTTATFQNGTTSQVVTIPPGATSTTATVNVGDATTSALVSIVGEGTLNLRQESVYVFAPDIQSAVPFVTTIKGGAQLPVTIMLTAPAGSAGLTITVTSDNPAVIPNQTIVVQAGETQQSLNVNTTSGATGSVHLTFKDPSGDTVPATDGQGHAVTITVD